MPHTKAAFDVLEGMIPLFKEILGPSPKALYVGWRHDCKPWWHDTFFKGLGTSRIGVVEVFPKNMAELEQLVWAGRYEVDDMYLDDVRNIDLSIDPGQYDLIFWDHGPEHVDERDIALLIDKLDWLAGKAVLFACPWGEWPQGMEDGNEHEVHRSTIYPETLTRHGMKVVTTGEPGQAGGGEIIAYVHR